MDASAVPPTLVRLPAASTRLAHWAALAATSALMLVAGWLAARRLGGALQQPLHGPAWVAVILLLALSAAALSPFIGRPRGARGDWRGAVLPWAAWWGLVLLAAAISLPGTPALALGGIWFAVLAPALALVWRACRSSRDSGPLPVASAQGSLGTAEDDIELPAGVEQQWSRSLDAHSGVVIQGWLRAALTPGQRSTSLHVGFCPPLRRIPAVSVEAIQGPPCTARIGLVLLQGARIDIRLDQPCTTDAAVVLAFHAQERHAEPTAT